jgi:HlyD family secretion protein
LVYGSSKVYEDEQMLERKWWFGLPIVLMVGVSAIAVGLVPGVRDWLDTSFPQLGINGPTELASSQANPETSATSPELQTKNDLSGSNGASTPVGLNRDEFASRDSIVSLDQPNPILQTAPVQFAQATLPVAQATLPVAQPQLGGPARISQSPNPASLPVPNGGLPVPSVQSSGSVFITDAQVLFPDDIPVAAQSDGVITLLNVDEGSMVKQGDLMIQIDSRLAEADSEVAKQELIASKLKSEDDSSIRFAEASVNVAQEEVRISDELMQQGVEGESDNRKKRLELIKAGLSVSVSKNEKEQQKSAVAVQEAKLAATKVQLELRKIQAPWNGFISEVAKKQHSFVRPGDVILRLTSMDKIRVRGLAKVTDAPHLLVNLPARVTISIAPGKSETIEGKVMSISPRTINTADTYPILIEVENRLTQDGQYLFREGMKATIEIISRSR